MEVEGGRQRKTVVCIYEMLGTALFVFAIMLTDKAYSVPFSLFTSIMIFGAITGGHFNPAVSLGVLLTADHFFLNICYFLMIVAAQVAGAFLAIGLQFCALYDPSKKPITIPPGLVQRLCPATVEGLDCENWDGQLGFRVGQQLLTNEVVGSFVFVAVVLMFKNYKTMPSDDGIASALGIALSLLGAVRTGNKFTTCYNPAAALALTVNQLVFLEDEGKSLSHYGPYYVAGPFLGALAAAVFFLQHRRLFEPDEQPHQKNHGKAFSEEHKEGLIGSGSGSASASEAGRSSSQSQMNRATSKSGSYMNSSEVSPAHRSKSPTALGMRQINESDESDAE